MSAKDVASRVQPGSNVRWDRLERAAFAGHPEVLAEGRTSRRPLAKLGPLGKVGLVLVALLSFALYFAPLWGLATIAEGRFTPINTDPTKTIPAASVFFIVAAVTTVASVVYWLRIGRRRSSLYLLHSVLAVVLGSLTAASMAKQGQAEPVENWELWMIPVVVSIVLGALFALAVLFFGARRTPTANAGVPANKVEILKQRRERVAHLGDREQESIRRDLDEAIRNLLDRGVISAEQAERAGQSELGALALRMPRG